jgi:hypothetical protein
MNGQILYQAFTSKARIAKQRNNKTMIAYTNKACMPAGKEIE